MRFKPSMTIGSKQICNDPACTGFEYVVCSASPVVAAPAPAPAPTGGHSIATIVVPDPNVHALNVRNRPNGTILTALPEGPGVGGGRLWLAAGGRACQGAGRWHGDPRLVPDRCPAGRLGVGEIPGVWRRRDCRTSTVRPTGRSATTTGDNDLRRRVERAHRRWHALHDRARPERQYGHRQLSGRRRQPGPIVGSVDGKQLSFAWNQADGLAGFGRFALSADGHTFQGSYSMRETPQKIEGSWNGSRR